MTSIPWKKTFSHNGLLYLILDTQIRPYSPAGSGSWLRELLRAGIDIVQLRFHRESDKDILAYASNLSKIVRQEKKVFLINNRCDIAISSNAHGVHLGATDIPVKIARKILGKSAVVGKTVHSVSELRRFQEEPVEYLGIGPWYKSALKPDLTPFPRTQLTRALREARKPLFAVGGIHEANAERTIREGARNIVVCRGILSQPKPVQSTKKIKECLRRAI
ncbi:MAG: thiamine phosphate synthase [Candidatus Omnitrophica bacterium]|nr:thiamine phosphate synthase [Candidatus Omnitrophota bacterium]